MSEDLYATPDMSKKVRGERDERTERIVDIYDSVDCLGGFESASGLQEEETCGPRTQATTGANSQTTAGNTVIITKRPFRAAAVCLGLLCLLLLAGIIVLVVLCIDDHNLAKERDQLQISYNNLTEERDNLQRKLCVLKEMVSSPQWYKHGSSWYYMSLELKTWNESRQDCQSRGADMVIINSREEQEYLIKLFNKRVWIGLTDIKVEGTWKWVDGTQLTTSLGFWYTPQPDNGGTPNVGEEDCVEIHIAHQNLVNKWNDLSCVETNYWICEKEI